MILFPEPPPSTPGSRGTPRPVTTDGASRLPRVQHIPADHPYVRHLGPPPGAPPGFSSLPDPGGPVTPGSWRPSPALDPAWIAAHADELDAVHLHFGYEHLDPAAVRAWCDAVHRAGRALVVTVHDLDNPHLVEQTRHHATVAAALSGADRVITLTPGAAQEIEQRWGRQAEVVDHPHVLPLDLVGTRATARPTGSRLRLGVPLGTLRANIAASAVLALLESAEAEVRVRVSRQVFDSTGDRGHAAEVRTSLRSGAERGRWHLDVVAPGEPEVQVWEWLSSLDALILPYAWGTHSAWVETCADVGTSVIAPATGVWHQQQPVISVPPWATADRDHLTAALARVRDPADPVGGGLRPVRASDRYRQRTEVHVAHAALYRTALLPHQETM